jgi:hypothetical protein
LNLLLNLLGLLRLNLLGVEPAVELLGLLRLNLNLLGVEPAVEPAGPEPAMPEP